MVHADWYRLSPDPSRLARTVGRLLTVWGPLPLEEVERQGGPGHPAPRDLDRRHPDRRVGGVPGVAAGVRASRQADRVHEADRGLLTGTDRALVGAFTRFPTGEVTTGELVSALTEAGWRPLLLIRGSRSPRCYGKSGSACSDCAAAVIGSEPNLDELPRIAWRLPNCGVTAAWMAFPTRHPGVAPDAGSPDG